MGAALRWWWCVTRCANERRRRRTRHSVYNNNSNKTLPLVKDKSYPAAADGHKKQSQTCWIDPPLYSRWKIHIAICIGNIFWKPRMNRSGRDLTSWAWGLSVWHNLPGIYYWSCYFALLYTRTHDSGRLYASFVNSFFCTKLLIIMAALQVIYIQHDDESCIVNLSEMGAYNKSRSLLHLGPPKIIIIPLEQ